jgi:hypothetical protein
MTFYCAACDVNWWPFQTSRGTCLRCGSGTKCTQDPPSENVTELYREVMDARARVDNHERFETYYFERELARGADAWKTP